jgi:hypothetical protein
MVVTNFATAAIAIELIVGSPLINQNQNCFFRGNTPLIGSELGPSMIVQANSTGVLTFPQPFVTQATIGKDPVCLYARGGDPSRSPMPVYVSIVGYKILP